MHRPIRRAIVLLAVALLALLAFNVAAAQSGQPGGITDEAHKMHDLWVYTLIIACVVFVGVESAIIFAVIRFRKKSDELPAQTHGSTIIEFIWTGIPVIIVIALFSYSFKVLQDVEHDHNPVDLTVNVQGFQFQWAFTYCLNDLGNGADAPAKARDETYQGPCVTKADEFSETGTAAKEPTVHIPVGKPVEFRLKSNDVIHSFYVRDFLYKLDVIPGRDNKFTVTARETGTFVGQCAELCGVNHALMRFTIEVMPQDKFDEWVKGQTNAQQAAKQP
jgi:cytochrome c oxidase subunit 2